MSQTNELNIIAEIWGVNKDHIDFESQHTAASDLLAHLIDVAGYQIDDIKDSELMEDEHMAKVIRDYTHEEEDEENDDYDDDYFDEDDY